MTQSVVTEAHEVSVLDVEREELASFTRQLVSDSHLRALFASDPGAAIDRSGIALSPATRAAIVKEAPAFLGASGGVDNPTVAAFFLIIITK